MGLRTESKITSLLKQLLARHSRRDIALAPRFVDFKIERSQRAIVAVRGAYCQRLTEKHLLKLQVECNCRPLAGTCSHSYGFVAAIYSAVHAGDSELQEVLSGALPNLTDYMQSLLAPLKETPPPELGTRERCVLHIISRGDRSFAIEFVHQRWGKRTWLRGRRITSQQAFEWFANDDAPLSKTAAVAIKRCDHRSRVAVGLEGDPYSTLRLLHALAGSDLVFFKEEDAPARIDRAEIGISLVEQGEGYHVAPSLNGAPCGPDARIVFPYYGDPYGGILDVRPHENHVLAAHTNDIPLLRSICNLQLAQLELGREEAETVARQLEALHGRVHVSLPKSLAPETCPGGDKIVVRLTPQGEGLTVALVAQPFEESECFTPGAGSAEFFHTASQGRVCVLRDLQAEIARGNELAARLGLCAADASAPYVWRLHELDAALDFVTLLQSLPEGEVAVQWPEDCKLAVAAPQSVAALRVEVVESRDWFGLKGMLAVDGDEVPLKLLLAGLRRGERYISYGRHKYLKVMDWLRERLQELAHASYDNRAGVEISPAAAPVLRAAVGDDVHFKACRGWQSVLKRLATAEALDPQPPVTLQAELRDYQLEGYRWLRRLAEWGVGACLADDMGLGKTVQSIAVLIDRRALGPSLVAAPTSVGFNWQREIERFAPTLQPILYRDADRSKTLSELGPGDVLILSYGLLLRDAEALAKVQWGTFVLDEAQKIKNSQTKTAQAARQIDAEWRLALTGTPLENHLGELWSIFGAISPGFLGSWERFRTTFAQPIEQHHDVERRQALARQVRPFLLRRTKSEVLTELPTRTEIMRTAVLSPAERARYDDARLAAAAALAFPPEDREDARFQVLAALTRLRQLACHPRLVDSQWRGSSAKLDLLLEIVDELREGKHRALIFSQFTKHLALICEAFDRAGISYQYLDGQTPPNARLSAIDAFQNGAGEFFLISLKAGGCGLNLTAADYVIHVDPWWNPAVEDQATDRAHRIGQTRPVTVYRLVSSDTIEEQILALHAEKRELVTSILEGSGTAAQLSTQELITLIRGEALSGAKRGRRSPAVAAAH